MVPRSGVKIHKLQKSRNCFTICIALLFPEGQLGEHQKSASFLSTHSNQSEDNIQLMQSSGSIEGHGGEGEEEGEGHTQGKS